MIKQTWTRIQMFLLLSVIPLMYGCNSGGGSADAGGTTSLGSLLGDGGTTTSSVLSSTAGAGVTSADQLASIHNPEPATVLLLGGGMIAMGYMQRKKKNR